MDDKGNRLARKRVENAIRNLKAKHSEFLYPLSRMELEENKSVEGDDADCLSTDGLKIYYSPEYVNKKYIETLEREVMHIILHGMLGHFMSKDDYREKVYRDALMDIQVTYLLDKMDGTESSGMMWAEKRLEGDFSMSRYNHAVNNLQMQDALRHIGRTLKTDNHEKWDESDEKREEVLELWGVAIGSILSEEEAELDLLQNVARIVFIGNGKNGFKTAFGVNMEKGRNYQEALEEIVRVQEIAKEEPHSIDPIFYHYGMMLYENTPLIEPREVNDLPKLNTLAIAIDVSASCFDKETMGIFWQETYECISQLKEEVQSGEVLLIQCDREIQKIERKELWEFAEVPEHIEAQGCGGTDFRPVFEYLDERRENGDIIDGLIYLSDGYGEYPEEQPDYPVHFVMEKGERWGRREMPEWVEVLWLEQKKK